MREDLWASAYRSILSDRMHVGHIYDLDEVRAMILAEDGALRDSDWEPWRGDEPIWHHHLHSVLQNLKRHHWLEFVRREHYRRTAEERA